MNQYEDRRGWLARRWAASTGEPQLVLSDEEGEDVTIDVRNDVMRVRHGSGPVAKYYWYDLVRNREKGEPLGAFGDRAMAEIIEEIRNERRGN